MERKISEKGGWECGSVENFDEGGEFVALGDKVPAGPAVIAEGTEFTTRFPTGH
jgi:hypothetical protein